LVFTQNNPLTTSSQLDNSVEVEIKPVKADAELMSAWLGEMEDTSISSKLLFDLQTLLRHYADFLVPDKNVTVEYKYEGTPCASVDKDQVFIPLDMLQEGRVDETISSVIHELHHIKHSYKESKICEKIIPYFKRILKTVEIKHYGKKMSIWDAVSSEGEITVGGIMERNLQHQNNKFIYQYFGDLFLLLNAIEDVRIDEMQPKNLLKYRFKQEKLAFEKFQDLYESGDLDKDSLFGSFIDALFHLKGYGHSQLVVDNNLTKDSILAVEEPKHYYQPTFSAFAKVLQDHAGGLWEQYKTQESMDDTAISDYLVSDAISNNDDGGAATEDESLDLQPKKSSDCKPVDTEVANQVRGTFGEDAIRDLLTAMGSDENEEGEPTQLLMNPQQWAEIQAFTALKHIPCREVVKELPQGVNYDTLILDCYA